MAVRVGDLLFVSGHGPTREDGSQWVGRLGQDHQIVLFSKDESLADRAEKAADWTIIRLPGPAAAPTPAEEAKEEVPSA